MLSDGQRAETNSYKWNMAEDGKRLIRVLGNPPLSSHPDQ